jgi:hypothetical protein
VAATEAIFAGEHRAGRRYATRRRNSVCVISAGLCCSADFCFRGKSGDGHDARRCLLIEPIPVIGATADLFLKAALLARHVVPVAAQNEQSLPKVSGMLPCHTVTAWTYCVERMTDVQCLGPPMVRRGILTPGSESRRHQGGANAS